MPTDAPLLTLTLTMILALGCGMLAGCGSSQTTTDGPSGDVHLSTFTLPPASTGPYDLSHRDEAIAAATRFAQRSQGHPTVSDPVAVFTTSFPTPQAPGHPLGPVSYGWNIAFKATYHALNAPGAAASDQDLPHIEGTAIPVPQALPFQNPPAATATGAKQAPAYAAAPSLAADQQPAATQAALSVPVNGPGATPDPYATPRLPGPDRSLVPASAKPPAAPALPPEARGRGLRREARQLTVFITVDGSLRLLQP